MLSIEEFGSLFDDLEHEAWRLLTLDAYDVLDDERRDFEQWQRTGKALDRTGEPWLRMIEDYTRRGVSFARTHVFPGRGELTPYCRYVLESYEANDAAGEAVSIADKEVHPQLASLHTDFWLLDDRVVVIEYDANRHYAGAYVAEGEQAGLLRASRELVARCAVSLASYKAG